ncbi:hypothetical protein ES703_30631 [subsurface metagenome]
MKKGDTTTQKKKVEEYMANYGEMTKKLFLLSQMNARQFLGTRAEGDPRVTYLTQMEAFKNLADVQLSTLLEVVSNMFGSKGGDLLKVFERTLSQQIASMEESLAVTGWNEDGTPILDLQAHLEKTKGWPQ